MKELIASHAQIVGEVRGKPVTRGALNVAFRKVEPANNWKMPIAAVIEEPSELEREMIAEAVTFFTGSIATFEPIAGGKCFVKAKGYYEAVGP
jgi:hypothetical protein